MLALLLMATLGAQYYLNLVTQAENADLREDQEAAISAGYTLGFAAMTAPGGSHRRHHRTARSTR